MVILSFKSLFVQDLSCMVCSLMCMLSWHGSVVLQLSLGSTAISTSGMPSSVGPPQGTTKNLHGFHLSLCPMVTLHTPCLGMHELLYACNMTFLYLATPAIVILGNSILNLSLKQDIPNLPTLWHFGPSTFLYLSILKIL